MANIQNIAMDKFIAYTQNFEWEVYSYTQPWNQGADDIYVPDFILHAEWPEGTDVDHLANKWEDVKCFSNGRANLIVAFYCAVDDGCKKAMLDYINENYEGHLGRNL